MVKVYVDNNSLAVTGVFSVFFFLQLIATNIEPLHSEFVDLVKKLLNNSDERQQFFQVSIFSIGYIPYNLFASSVKSALIIVP